MNSWGSLRNRSKPACAPRGREATRRSLISCFAARANKQLARDETDGCTMPEPIWSSSPRLACEVPEDDPLAGESETVANSCASTLPTEVTDPNVGDPPSTGAVWLCRRVAQIQLGQELGLEHWWIMTPDREAGMGRCGGGVPGAQSDSPFITQTCVNDHNGEHAKTDVQCEPLSGFDPACVDDELKLGRPLGRWTPTNQCQAFVQEVLDACKPRESPSDGAEGTSGQ